METALELVKLASVGLIAGLFSSVLANRDHRHRKWWELRIAAYQNVIEALSDLVYYYDRHFSAAIEARQLSNEFEEKLKNYWEKAYPRVRKAADSGAFLFSDEANQALRELIKDDDTDWWVEHLEIGLGKAQKCLTQLVECSKNDLRLKPSRLDQ